MKQLLSILVRITATAHAEKSNRKQMKKIAFLLIISFLTNFSSLCQVRHEPCVIIHISEGIEDIEESPIFNDKYCILPISKLKKTNADTSCVGCIICQISKSGGYLVHIDRDSYVYTCCKTGDIEKNIYHAITNDSGEINKLDHLPSNKDMLKKRMAKVIKLKMISLGKVDKLQFEIWKGDIDYCICDAYMEGSLGSVANKLAYVTMIQNAKKINKTEYRQLKSFILGIWKR